MDDDVIITFGLGHVWLDSAPNRAGGARVLAVQRPLGRENTDGPD